MPVLEILMPVFVVVLLGAVLARVGFLGLGVLVELNRLVYWVGLPAFLFGSVAEAEFEARLLPVPLVFIGATLFMGVLGCGVAALRGLPRTSWGTFVQAVTRGNIAYVGLSVIALATPHTATQTGDMRAIALLTLGPAMVAFNLIAVMALAASRPPGGRGFFKTASGEIVSNPLIISMAAGAIVSWSGLELPRWVQTSVGTIGSMALPLALICIGGALVTTRMDGRRVSSVLAALLKVMVAPAVGLGLAKMAGLGADETRVILIFLASPTAAASFVLVGKMGGDTPLAAGAVVVSTMMSVVPLALVLAFA